MVSYLYESLQPLDVWRHRSESIGSPKQFSEDVVSGPILLTTFCSVVAALEFVSSTFCVVNVAVVGLTEGLVPLGDVFDFGVVGFAVGFVPLGDVIDFEVLGLAEGLVPSGNVFDSGVVGLAVPLVSLGYVFDFRAVGLAVGLMPSGNVFDSGVEGLAVPLLSLGDVFDFGVVFKGSLDKVDSSSDCCYVNEVSGLAKAFFIEVVLKIVSAWNCGVAEDAVFYLSIDISFIIFLLPYALHNLFKS